MEIQSPTKKVAYSGVAGGRSLGGDLAVNLRRISDGDKADEDEDTV